MLAKQAILPIYFAMVILEMGSCYVPELASNHDLPFLSLPRRWDNGHEPSVPEYYYLF
jgi:hypothetical protein